VARNFVMIN